MVQVLVAPESWAVCARSKCVKARSQLLQFCTQCLKTQFTQVNRVASGM